MQIFLWLILTVFVCGTIAQNHTESADDQDDNFNVKLRRCAASMNVTYSVREQARAALSRELGLLFAQWDMLAPVTNRTEECRLHEVVVQCIKQIPSDFPGTGLAIRAMEQYGKLVCDEEVALEMPCVNRVGTNKTSDCASQCLSFKENLDTLLSDRRSPNPEKQKELIGETCKLANCRIVCSKQDIVDTCGQSSFDALKKSLKLYRNTLLALFQPFGVLEDNPSSCSDENILKDL